MMLPRTLEITTITPCPVNCASHCCPQHKLISAYKGSKLLSFENFKKALSNVPHSVCIDFSGFGDPLSNPACKDMILHAHSQDYKIRLFSTFANVKWETWNAIKDVPFDLIMVHLPDIHGYTKVEITEDYLKIIQAIMQTRVETKFMSMSETSDILPEIRKIMPNFFFQFQNCFRAGNCAGSHPQPRLPPYTCRKLTKEFTAYVMLPDCSIVLCCMDYSLKHRLGNLLTTTYDELFKSPGMIEILTSDDPLCRLCSCSQGEPS